MSTSTARDVQPVNRIAGLLPPPGKTARDSASIRPGPEFAPVNPEPPQTALTWMLIATMAAAFLATFVWPAVLVALVLLLVLMTPLIALGIGVAAIFRRVHHRT